MPDGRVNNGGKTYEIWTLEKAEEYCEKVYQYAVDHEDCYTLGMAAVQCGEYEEVITYIQKKFEIEFQSIKKAKQLIKERCVKLGMQGKTNATMTIFNLVNNFDMFNTNAKQQVSAKVEGSMTWNETKTYQQDSETNSKADSST